MPSLLNPVPTNDDIGVNVHSAARTYSDRISDITTRLNEVGAGWIRDNNPKGAAIWKNAGFKGKVLSVVNKDYDAQTAIDVGTDAIDAVNEIDTDTGLTTEKADVTAIVTKVNGRVPIIATSIASINGTKADALGYQPHARRGNCHCYHGMRAQSLWQNMQAEFVRQAGKAASGKPLWVTETGYHDYLVPGKPATYKGVENNNHQMTPDDVAAQQIIPDLLGFFALGVEKVFFYEFIDEWPFKPATGKSDHEGYFGLLKSDLTWKPHGQVLVDQMKLWTPPPPPDTKALEVQIRTLTDQLTAEQARNTDLNTRITNYQKAHDALMQ